MTMEDCVIEVDDKSCCEELTDWHREVTLKLFGESGTTKICDNLDYALQEYNRILKKYETNRGIKQILKDRILDHVKTFHSFLPKCSIWTGASSYIETMQNVLIILCNLELEMATDIKISNSMEYSTKIMEITERIVYILPIYLLGDNVGICHVLLKLRPRFQSRQWKDIMRVIYRHFLVMAPVYDKSKENFCRNYLLFQNLKAITNKKDHPRIDALLYSKFGLTSDVLKTNQKIRRILRPLSNSIIDLVDMLTDHKQSPINNYFKYMAKKKKEKETPLSIYLGSESEEEEDVPHFVKQVPCRSRLQDSDAVILVDDDNIKTEASNSIICLDDDSDCEVTVSPSEEKCTRKKPPDLPLPSPGLSFLDLIAIPNKTISTLESPPYSIETERSPASDDQFQSAETNFDENELDKAQRMEETCTSADTITNEFLELSMPSTVEDKTENAEKESEAVETKESESHISSDSVAEIQTEAETDINDKSEENEPADIGPSSDTEQECTDNLDCTQNAEKCLPNGGYNLMHGLITPPKSDRTSDDVVTGAKNVYVPDIMRIDSICYDGFENLPLIAESSSYEDAAAEDNENKRHEESQSYENYESPENLEELQVELDQNLELPESINISDINLNAVCEDSSGDILADIVSTEEQSLDSSLFKSTPQTCVDDATKGPSANSDDLIDDTRTGGSKSDFHANLEPKQVIDKIIFTSSEKLSAPLALFSKFEQLQSELVENACSGPIEPMRILVNSAEHSNSNDSLGCAISPCRPFPENSPTSPPFEQINTRDYQIHLDRYLSSRKNGEVIRTEPHKTIITVPTDRKKKLGEVDEKEIKPHVPKKVRFDGLPLIENDILSEAKDSLARYKISKDDTKLVFLQPQVPIRIESMHELKEKEEVLKLRSKLYNSNNTDNKYTIKRVDYKQVNGTVISPPEIRHSVSNLIHNNLNSTVEGIPSGYTPAVNGYTSVHGLQRNNSMERKQNFNSQQQNQFNDSSNSGILNLSVSSTVNALTELDTPESEFSRSPKLLQNTDQIVQQCLIDNLDNTVEPDITIHKEITLLSNNSNFYSTPDATLPTKSPVSNPVADSYINYKDDLEELLSKDELEKLFDDKNCETEITLPLKKRRLLPKVNEPVPFKEEISYPATPMISIAEIEALTQNCAKNNRSFKTAAERKEMPPIPLVYNKNSSEPTPIITDQFNINNHTYNNPTINYHMNNVPLPFINVPCAPYYSFPPFIVPFNNVTTYPNLSQDCATIKKEEEHQIIMKNAKKQKKEKKKQHAKTKEFFQQFLSDKKFIF